MIDLTKFDGLTPKEAEIACGRLGVEFHPIVCEHVTPGVDDETPFICNHITRKERDVAVLANDETPRGRVPSVPGVLPRVPVEEPFRDGGVFRADLPGGTTSASSVTFGGEPHPPPPDLPPELRRDESLPPLPPSRAPRKGR